MGLKTVLKSPDKSFTKTFCITGQSVFPSGMSKRPSERESFQNFTDLLPRPAAFQENLSQKSMLPGIIRNPRLSCLLSQELTHLPDEKRIRRIRTH